MKVGCEICGDNEMLRSMCKACLGKEYSESHIERPKSKLPLKPHKERLAVNISIKDTSQFKTLLNIFTRIITDERIDKNVRESYLEEFISNVGD